MLFRPKEKVTDIIIGLNKVSESEVRNLEGMIPLRKNRGRYRGLFD